MLLVCDDTDVFKLAVAKMGLTTPILQKRGTQATTRYVNIIDTSNTLGFDVATSLPGIHIFKGCDTTSAFACKGKIFAFKLLCGSRDYQMLFAKLGEKIEVDHVIMYFLQISSFVV